MAKSDSFFIRAQVNVAATSEQTEIDLGSFVNLGVKSSSLLRIHNIAVQYADSDGPQFPLYATVSPGAQAAWQLTTQTQSQLVFADDKSLIASGQLTCYGNPTSTAHPQGMFESSDVNPQMWRNGYLVGVDSLFLRADQTGTFSGNNLFVTIVMECTIETATQANSVALALSQQ
jgi:hypothetical protein